MTPVRHRLPRRAAGCALAFAALAACGSPSGAGSGSPTTSTDSPSGATGGAGADAQPAPDPRPITLAFAGDTHFWNQVEPRLHDSAQEWATRLPELKKADLAMVNLETAIATHGVPERKNYTFRTSPKALKVLDEAGVDVVTMANNHAADYGKAGLDDTFAAIRTSPVPVIGIGPDEKTAYAPAVKEVRGLKIAFLAASQVDEETARHFPAGPSSPGIALNLDPAKLTAATKAAVADNDLVVVYMHWGTEGSTCPSEGQRNTARQLQEAGADIIVGTHAHRPQGSGWLDRAFVGYGLGNYVWYNTSGASASSGVLTLTVDPTKAHARRAGGDGSASPVTKFDWTPKLISPGGIPKTPEGGTAQRLDDLARAAQQCAALRS